MCGDVYCYFCGPAQGNYKCPICKKWTYDGGCKNPKVCEEKLKEMEEEARLRGIKDDEFLKENRD